MNLEQIVAQQARQSQQMVIASPFNDVQFLALLAGQLMQCYPNVKDAVSMAADLTVEASAMVGSGELAKRLQKRAKQSKGE